MDQKRYYARWLPGNHEGTHNDCDCDLHVSFPCLKNVIPDITVMRYNGGRKSIQEMYAEVKGLLHGGYLMTEKGVEKRKEYDEKAYLTYLREYHTSKSQIAVDPPFNVKNDVTALTEEARVSAWRPVHAEAEQRYWARIYPAANNIDISEKRDGLPTLKAMCKKLLSWEDAVYGVTERGAKRVVHTKEFFPIEKSLALYSEFDVNTAQRTPSELQVWKYTKKAMNSLLMAMGAYENHGRLVFKYEPKKLIKKVRLFTSGGIMPGMNKKFVGKDGQWYRTTATGAKVNMLESAMRKLHKIMSQLYTEDEVICKAIIAVIKAKDEFKYGQFKTHKELLKMLMKIREFFIPDLTHIYMCIMANEERMLLERNNVIRIGMTYWHGGAYYLCKYLNYGVPGMFWVDGDIEGLDKHISDWLLLLYCAGVHPYYNWKTMTEKEVKLLERLLEYWATNVCCKLVNHIGGFWRYMMGVMYSGGKETSHGDSWIMAFIFYCFCEHTKAMHPHMAGLIDIFMIRAFIAIVVYGDDHIWCAPRILENIMNHITWKAFLKTYFHMNLRDENIYYDLISVKDHSGRLKKRGPKFLKRYFILNDDPRYAPILPYKEIDEQMCKAFTWKFPTVAENVATVIGFAWDTMGTNVPAYNVIADLYCSLMATTPKTPLELLRDIDLSDRKNVSIQRLMRKVNLRPEEFFKFPTRETLMRRHVLDPEKANFHIKVEDLEQHVGVFDFDMDLIQVEEED